MFFDHKAAFLSLITFILAKIPTTTVPIEVMQYSPADRLIEVQIYKEQLLMVLIIIAIVYQLYTLVQKVKKKESVEQKPNPGDFI